MKRVLQLTAIVAAFGFLASCGSDDPITVKQLEISFDESGATVAENADPVTVTISFPEAKIAADVSLAVSGTAVYGEDYTTSPEVTSGEIVFSVAKGETELSFTFTPIDDDFYSPDLEVVAELVETDVLDLNADSDYKIVITDDGDLSNETIDLGDGQAFNMSNFLTSFEQIFPTQESFFWSFEHETEEGMVVETTHIMSAFGGSVGFGGEGPSSSDPVEFIEHEYKDGVIVSSVATGYSSDEANLAFACTDYAFNYTFDDEGYIVAMKQFMISGGTYEVEFTYNDAGQIVLKTYIEDEGPRGAVLTAHRSNGEEPTNPTETIVYNGDGTIASVSEVSYYGSYFYEYSYTDGLMTQMKAYDGVDATADLDFTYSVSYDSEARIIEMQGMEGESEEVVEHQEYSYTETTGTVSYFSYDLEEYREEYAYGGKPVESRTFYYGYDECTECKQAGIPTVLQHVRVQTYGEYVIDERGGFSVASESGGGCQSLRTYVDRIDILDGAEDLVGYVTIDERDSYYGYKITESVFGADNTLLYTLDFSEYPGDYCYVVITDEVADEEVSLYGDGGMLDTIEWYYDAFPNNYFCD